MTPAQKFNRDMARLVANEIQASLDDKSGGRLARATVTAGTALAVIISASMAGDRKGTAYALDEILKHIRMKLDELSTGLGK